MRRARVRDPGRHPSGRTRRHRGCVLRAVGPRRLAGRAEPHLAAPIPAWTGGNERSCSRPTRWPSRVVAAWQRPSKIEPLAGLARCDGRGNCTRPYTRTFGARPGVPRRPMSGLFRRLSSRRSEGPEGTRPQRRPSPEPRTRPPRTPPKRSGHRSLLTDPAASTRVLIRARPTASRRLSQPLPARCPRRLSLPRRADPAAGARRRTYPRPRRGGVPMPVTDLPAGLDPDELRPRRRPARAAAGCASASLSCAPRARCCCATSAASSTNCTARPATSSPTPTAACARPSSSPHPRRHRAARARAAPRRRAPPGRSCASPASAASARSAASSSAATRTSARTAASR